MSDHLHIVCLDAPSPPDYGGAIDMYYKVQALAESGKKIILHYFHYKEHRNANGLEKYCTEVNVYSRGNSLSALSFTKPYIANSRINKELINRLNKDDYPILLEGLHCMGIIPYLQQPSRVVVRMHNEEAAYYKALALNEPNFLRKAYYSIESARINRFQNKFNHDLKLAVLSNKEVDIFKQQGFSNVHFIPCFVPWQEIRSLTGKGEYCLYHGNMSIIENEIAALWLINHVFDQINIPLVIAGKGISGKLQKIARKKHNLRLIYQPPSNELDALIKDAHINVLPSFNTTGVKLKLLHALFYGRFCIANNQGIKGSGISSSVYTAETAEDFRKTITTLFEKPFSEEQVRERQSIRDLYNNKTNALTLSAIW